MRYYKDDSLILDILLHLLLYGNHFSIQPSILQIQNNILALSFNRYIHHTYCIHREYEVACKCKMYLQTFCRFLIFLLSVYILENIATNFC